MSKDDLDLLGDEVEEAISGSDEALENAAEKTIFFSSTSPTITFRNIISENASNCPSHSGNSPLIYKNKIQNKIEKSQGYQLNIQLQQQVGVFKASIMEILPSLRDKIKSV